MRSFAILALAGAVAALPQPQAVTSAIAPKESTPAGCSENYTGEFMISVVNVTKTAKRSIQARADKALTVKLSGGVLTDDQGRTGYIASNNQFQFDGPVQAGAIYTAGWSICSNSTLALGNSAIFYQCLSGTFYNLYDESTGAQCSEIYIDVIPASGSSSASGVATQIADGQVTASAVASPISQISDGQIQATTGLPKVVTQISDGQIQQPTGAVVTQISDGQIQVPTTTSKAVVTQISDGQIQAVATTSKAVVSQISDGQIQAPASSSRAVVTQISDGQIQAAATNGTAPTRASATPSVSVFTGGASTVKTGVFGLAAGVVAMALL